MTSTRKPAGERSQETVHSYRETYPNAFGLPILDDSMAPGYLPGSVVVIDRDQRWENGATCLVLMDDGKASLKVFHDHGRDVIVKPVNDKGPALVAKKGSALDSRVLGKAVGVISDPKSPERMMKLREDTEAERGDG